MRARNVSVGEQEQRARKVTSSAGEHVPATSSLANTSEKKKKYICELTDHWLTRKLMTHMYNQELFRIFVCILLFFNFLKLFPSTKTAKV